MKYSEIKKDIIESAKKQLGECKGFAVFLEPTHMSYDDFTHLDDNYKVSFLKVSANNYCNGEGFYVSFDFIDTYASTNEMTMIDILNEGVDDEDKKLILDSMI